MKTQFFWKSTCTSCREARAALRQRPALQVDAIDYAKTGLTAETVCAIVAAAGAVAPVLNTRHAIAKAKGWKAAPPDAETFAAAVAQEPNLLRRPIVIAGTRVIVGFDAAAYETL